MKLMPVPMSTSIELPDRVNILGVGVHALNLSSAIDVLDRAVANGQKGYVAVTGVHGIMEAQDDSKFKNILNQALLTTPDGMPTVWIGRDRGYSDMRRVYGPDLMLNVCRRFVDRGCNHFLYGGEPGVAKNLAEHLEKIVPGVRIVGTYTPPFRPLNLAEERDLIRRVRELRPEFFWVGLSTPKQERFMAEYIDKLDTKVMLGVGAAFDILSGRVKDAPDWVKTSGLQWLHRLFQDPRRLWKRYLINNPRFAYRILRENLTTT